MIEQIYLAILVNALATCGQILNRPPHFIPGIGDMAKFSLREGTPVGTPVYQLKGSDPERGQLHYSISGHHFGVDRYSGVVTLQQPLDRETNPVVEVIISITDEGVAGTEPNTISLRREITVLDENDNAPVFHNRPYHANVSENVAVGHKVLTMTDILVTDKDQGANAMINIRCFPDANAVEDDICDTFDVETLKITENSYKAHIFLAKDLDYEQRSTYVLTLKASDAGSRPLSAFASVVIDVVDVQDQPPIFINAPYSATIPENTPQGTSILKVKAKDGDFGNPRSIVLSLENDPLGYFDLITDKNSDYAVLVTSDTLLDRENSYIQQNGGIYSFDIKATELINNELPADYSTTKVTIVVSDEDDQLPVFNQNYYEVNVSEDISNDTPLPGLNIVIVDNDLGANSRYDLSLAAINFDDDIFEVIPEHGEGRTAVVIKVVDASKLDYDLVEAARRKLQFELIASRGPEPLAVSLVTVNILDANDNAPEFNATFYKLHVLENSMEGYKIADIHAMDVDSGEFGRVRYHLKGFGAEKFRVNERDGGVFVNGHLDYETQKSYTLTLEAVDGGGKVTSVNVFVDVDDVNDNVPFFESREYMRTVREGATEFEPQLFVHAEDIDGPTQGGGRIYYSIESTNSITETLNGTKIFTINANTGEVQINRPVRSMDTPRGQYDLIIKATDAGIPPLSNETRLLVRVGIAGNQRAIFKGNYDPSHGLLSTDGFMYYSATIDETATPGTDVIRVRASDPDGLDSALSYFIADGHKDNFVIDERTGLIQTSPYSNLDLDSNPRKYNVIVHAIDNGEPIHETATTTVFVTVRDVNDKAPQFEDTPRTGYVSEKAKPGHVVLTVHAVDRDDGSVVTYAIVEPISAKDRTGTEIVSGYDFKRAFRVDDDGHLRVNQTLDYSRCSMFVLTIEARDVKAEVDVDRQIARVEVTIFVQAYSDGNSILFEINNDSHAKFDAHDRTIHLNVDEEQPIGYNILKLTAYDVKMNNKPITNFKVRPGGSDLFTVLQNGEVILTKRLDYEALTEKTLNLTVMAMTDDGERDTEVTIFVDVMDVNDNYPLFNQNVYKASVKESARYPHQVLQVNATDLDGSNGFGDVRYSIHGESSHYFTVNSTTGIIQLSPNLTIDREKQSVLRFNITASDSPHNNINALKSTALVLVDVIDVNDNAPTFTQRFYTAVIAENAVLGTSVINITAADPDEGAGGQVIYEIIDDNEIKGYLEIDRRTGAVRTAKLLTGKGRTDPYSLAIRAQDGGGLSNDIVMTLYVADINTNDGVPNIIKPTEDQKVNISENASIGTPVFQVVALDPDDPSAPSGQIIYKLLDDGVDYLSFAIDSQSGLITVRLPLDREKQDRYTLALVVQDKGDPPQQATRILTIDITDVDDHKPRFERFVNAAPVSFALDEEVPVGTVVGSVAGVDEDIGANGAIDYVIISGNDEDWFTIERSEDNVGTIKTLNRIDNERNRRFLLTVKCFKASEKHLQASRKSYNNLDPSEMQVEIIVNDLDDNAPVFESTNLNLGVRLNVPIDTALVTLKAIDADSDALPIQYSLLDMKFTPLIDFGDEINITKAFNLDATKGVLRTARSLVNYVDGVFKLTVQANNSDVEDHRANVTVKIFVIRDRDLLKFVFDKPPATVRQYINEFEASVQRALNEPATEVHIYDTQFYMKPDNSLDFSSTSSCFQIVGTEAFSANQMWKVLAKDATQSGLKDVYNKYHVIKVESCAQHAATNVDTTATQFWVLLLAVLIGVAAIVASCFLCCLHRKYKKSVKKQKQMQSHFMPNRTYSNEPLYSS